MKSIYHIATIFIFLLSFVIAGKAQNNISDTVYLTTKSTFLLAEELEYAFPYDKFPGIREIGLYFDISEVKVDKKGRLISCKIEAGSSGEAFDTVKVVKSFRKALKDVFSKLNNPDKPIWQYNLLHVPMPLRYPNSLWIDEPSSVPVPYDKPKASFQGGDATNFTKWVNKQIVYPKKALEEGKEGTVIVQFKVDEDGNVTNVKLLRGVSPELDAEALRVVSNSPKWEPACFFKGRGIPIIYTFPVVFKLPKEEMENAPFPITLVSPEPTFQGGEADAFSKWIKEHKIYPQKAIADKVQGRVTVRFTVDEEGYVTNVEVLRGISPELDAEAVRVVSSSPRWNKAKDLHTGEPLSIKVVFLLSDIN